MIDPGMPIGVILPYAGPLAQYDAPDARLQQIGFELLKAGWRFCDGSLLHRGDYFLLHAVIGNAYGGNDTHFNLPNLQGCFMRGTNGGAASPDDLSRIVAAAGGNTGNRVGSYQKDAFQKHQHNYTMPMENPEPLVVPADPPEVPGIPMCEPDPMQVTTGYVVDGGGPPATADETRPVNLNVNFIIRCGPRGRPFR